MKGYIDLRSLEMIKSMVDAAVLRMHIKESKTVEFSCELLDPDTDGRFQLSLENDYVSTMIRFPIVRKRK